MGQLYDEDWEHVDIEAFREAIIGNGVITGLEVTQSATPAMTVLVSAGQCTIDSVVYAESSGQNVNVGNGDATHDRKDIVVYDASAGTPAVIAGIAAAAPVPPDIPAGDILLGIVLVEANEVTSILNADITEDRVYAIDRWPYTAVSVNTTLNDAHKVVSVDASGGARTITLPTAVGVKGKVYAIKKIDATGNAITVDGNAAETIDGSATISIPLQWSSIIIQSDGANWLKVGNKTDNEVRDAVEAATDSNTFKDADHTKLNGIESGATPDQTGAEIKAAYEVESNAFTDTKNTKLATITESADVTGDNAPKSHHASHEIGGSDPITSVVPSGCILMWSGAIVNIPTGWVICDGTNSTPNLEDRFVVGAGSTYAVDGTGGTTAHNHGLTRASYNAGSATTFSAYSSRDHLPPYYALAYIMKT